MENNKLPFGSENYKYMLIGLVILGLGFIIMTLDSEPHGFGFLGITLGPLVVLLGFAVQFFAILQKPKS
ncbi:DUF3098 domain-containing protein [Rapidithrix thailandica]|uniref:DUF3098 domain-containing protein n=1 Tax=Rapidithrix thailandica TaxID=413964 RepID=A0AAW9SJS8_9BACT